MKKFFGIALVTLLAVSFAFAQTVPYKVGDQTVTAGLGIGMAGLYGTSTLPPINISYETALSAMEGKLSIGGLVGFAGSKEEIPWITWSGWVPTQTTITYKYTYIIVGARAAYHYPVIDNIDTYGGLMLGYNIVSNSIDGAPAGWSGSASASYLAIGGFVGGKYFFTPNLGAYAELGYGVGFINLGIAYKL